MRGFVRKQGCHKWLEPTQDWAVGSKVPGMDPPVSEPTETSQRPTPEPYLSEQIILETRNCSEDFRLSRVHGAGSLKQEKTHGGYYTKGLNGRYLYVWGGRCRKPLSLARWVVRTQATYLCLNHGQDLASMTSWRQHYFAMKVSPGKDRSVSNQHQVLFTSVDDWSRQKGPLILVCLFILCLSKTTVTMPREVVPGSKSWIWTWS